MRLVFLIIQFLCPIFLFNEIIYLVKNWKSMLYSYLLLNCISGFINTLCYLAALYAETLESYVTAVQLSYAGRVWYTFTLLLFTAELCKIKFPRILKHLIMIFNTTVYFFVITMRKNGIYYVVQGFSLEGMFPCLIWTKGPLYDWFMLSQAVFMVVIFTWLFLEIKKEKNPVAKKKFIVVISAMIALSVSFIIEMIGIKGIKGYYDVTMIGALISTLLMYLAILRYDLMETKELAEKFMIDRLSEGIIATDSEGVVQYFNNPAKKLFPELEVGAKKIPDKVLDMIEYGKERKKENASEHISIEERIFLAEENELTQNGKNLGKIYTLIDETEHVRYMKEKEERRVQEIEIENYKNQIRIGNETIFSIANAVDARDKNTGSHSFRVAEYSMKIAEKLGFTEDEQKQIHKTGLLHDIGKIGVPDSILNKPDKLTEEEYEIMKNHVIIGSEILKDFTLIPHVDEGARFHHERYDGKGYPSGLAGEEIPLNARIIGIADAFDAMTSNRVYRKALGMDFVKEELRRCSGTQFDPKLVGILLSLIENKEINPPE